MQLIDNVDDDGVGDIDDDDCVDSCIIYIYLLVQRKTQKWDHAGQRTTP